MLEAYRARDKHLIEKSEKSNMAERILILAQSRANGLLEVAKKKRSKKMELNVLYYLLLLYLLMCRNQNDCGAQV